MQRIQFGSPAKQNATFSQLSPIKKGKTGTLMQIVTFLKSSGITLPPNIARIINNGTNFESPLKQAATNRESVDDSKKLKIQLCDLQFQFKKLQQDFAEFKRAAKTQKERESKKYEDIINRLKSSLEISNQDGVYNISKLKSTHQEQITQLKEKAKLELQQEVNKIRIELQGKIDNMQKIHKREITELQKNFDKQYQEKVKFLQDQIESLKLDHSKQLKEINQRHKQLIDDKQRRHQSIRLALESERKTEEKLFQKAKVDFSKQKEKLITELCYEKNVNNHLSEQIVSKQKQITSLKHTIKDKDIDLQLLDEKRKKQLLQSERTFQEKLRQLQKLQNQKTTILKTEQLSQLESLCQRMQNIQVLHKQKEEMMASNIEQLTYSFQRRPSKRQDISELQKMKWALAKKEEEIRKLNRDLKHCNLELQNKQEMYTRIFRGNSMSREKKNRQKEDKQQAIVDDRLLKEPIFRKSQTSDIKFLLKMYNNTKIA